LSYKPNDTYKKADEQIRNREIETGFRAINEKLAELEARIRALEP